MLELYETVAEPLAPRTRCAQRARPTTSPSPRPRPCASSSRPPARSRRALAATTRIVSIGPVTSADAARARPRRRRPRGTSEATTSTALARRPLPSHDARGPHRAGAPARAVALACRPPIVTFLSDYGLDDEFVGVCHGVIARRCPRAHVIDIAHAIPRHDVRAGALTLRRRAALHARRRPPRGRRSRGRRRRQARPARGRHAPRRRGPAARRARQRPARARAASSSAARSRPSTSAARPSAWSRSRRPSTAATSSRPSPPRWPPESRSRASASRCAVEELRSAGAAPRASSAATGCACTSLHSTASAT